MEPASDSAELRFLAKSGEEAHAREDIARVAASAGFDPERIEEIRTAVNEACLNALEHSDGRSFTVRYSVHRTGLIVEIRNSGQPFRMPESTPDLAAKMDGEQLPRGWGLYLMRRLCSRLGISHKGGINVIHMEFDAHPRHTHPA